MATADAGWARRGSGWARVEPQQNQLGHLAPVASRRALQGRRQCGRRLADSPRGDADTIRTTIANARAGVMPAWGGRLDEVTIRMLAVYVHSLGGGEGNPPVQTAGR